MKSTFVVLLILLMSGPQVSYPPVGPSVGLGLEVTRATTSGTVRLEIVPTAGKTLRIWKETNAWGWGRWRVLVIRNGHVETYVQRSLFSTINVPGYIEIPKDNHLVQELDLNAGNWCGFGQCSTSNEHGIAGKEVAFQPGDMVVVIYDVPPSVEAVKMGVWYGVAAAATTVQ